MGLKMLTILLSIQTVALSQEVHEHPTIRRMHHVSNSLRFRVSLPNQSLSPSLSRAAQFQAEFMAKTHKFSHYENGSPGKRAGRYGYNGLVVENIARSYNSVEETFFAWAESPKHWEAIIEEHTEVGFGYSIAKDGTTYWVAVYGTPKRITWSTPSPQSIRSPLPSPRSQSQKFVHPGRNFLLVGS